MSNVVSPYDKTHIRLEIKPFLVLNKNVLIDYPDGNVSLDPSLGSHTCDSAVSWAGISTSGRLSTPLLCRDDGSRMTKRKLAGVTSSNEIKTYLEQFYAFISENGVRLWTITVSVIR
ncbi:hypothetical protein J6590_036184 [Homalodisca vitripennis]|nr:hypothetical protein J6590_036184 [Homalodisca vitripennis]